jgi:hypothetical protein
MIEIEKGIPKPPTPEGYGIGRRVYPWHEMEIGDSFFGNRVPFMGMRVAAAKAGKRLGMKFEVHRESSGHRVWRTE